MSKVYFNHTTKLGAVKQRLAPAATIALRREGNVFHYGITICSQQDNYNKEQGRLIAETRLEQGFRSTPVPADLLALDSTFGEDRVTRTFLYQLSVAVTRQSKKWRKKITKFNMERKENGKIIAMNARKQIGN